MSPIQIWLIYVNVNVLHAPIDVNVYRATGQGHSEAFDFACIYILSCLRRIINDDDDFGMFIFIS